MEHLGLEAQQIISALQRELARLDDHKSQPERAIVYSLIAAHLRSAAPKAFSVPVDAEPLVETRIPLGATAYMEVTPCDGGALMHVMDDSGHDVAVTVWPATAAEITRVMGRVR